MRFRDFLKALIASALIPSSAASNSSEVEILFNNFLPPQHIISQKVWPEWAKQVEQATDGRVTVKLPPSSLAPPQRSWEVVTQGLADGAFIFHGFAENRLTLPLVAQLPWLASDSAEAMSVALWRTYQHYAEQVDEYQDVVLIGMYSAPPAEVYSLNSQPVESLKGLRNVRSWALAGVPAQILDAADVPIEAGPAVRGHEFVSHGVVDAYAGISFYDSAGLRMLTYVKSVTDFSPKMSTPTFSVFLSKNIWQRISPEDRKAIRAVSGESLARLAGSVYDRANAKARQGLMNSGIPFHKPSEAFVQELHGASQPVTRAWLKKVSQLGVDGEQVIARYRRELRRAEQELSVE